MPQIAPKEERRVLRHASDGLRGEVGCYSLTVRLFAVVPQVRAKEEGSVLST